MTDNILPIHPFTGLTAIGLRRDGRPIWPVMGGDGTGEPPKPDPPADPPKPDAPKPDDPPAGDPPDDDKLGDAGKKALDAERTRAKAAEKQLKEAQAKLKTLEDRDKSEADKAAERLAAAEKTAAEATAKLLKLEVAAAKGLTPTQATRLVGATREELEADADAFLADLPAKPSGTPKPDPSQGTKGTPAAARPKSLGQAVAGALKKA